jgi:hypothetical protein
MGAVLTHGRRLEKNRNVLSNGDFFYEIVPVDGDYAFPSYSSVKEMIQFGEKKGIDPASWPVYYGMPIDDVQLDEVCRRCAELRQMLTKLTVEDSEQNHWLRRVSELLSNDEVFCITE